MAWGYLFYPDHGVEKKTHNFKIAIRQPFFLALVGVLSMVALRHSAHLHHRPLSPIPMYYMTAERDSTV